MFRDDLLAKAFPIFLCVLFHIGALWRNYSKGYKAPEDNTEVIRRLDNSLSWLRQSSRPQLYSYTWSVIWGGACLRNLGIKAALRLEMVQMVAYA